MALSACCTLPRVWTKLSNDRAEALRLWAQHEGEREDEPSRLFSVMARRYVREMFPTKSAQNRRDNDHAQPCGNFV